ncbi:UDP-N-acetylmuramate dehydrogenase [Candidatus Nomurabacteria bacterium]|nr:UDP-N-acetylmuramate dehydrogenase [Candidatus Nomurabacteria bacterium]
MTAESSKWQNFLFWYSIVGMTIEKNYDLKKLNTLSVSARAKLFVEIKSEEDLRALFLTSEFKENNKFFLGGGSNVLFTKDFNGIVVKVSILGKKVLEESEESVLLEVNAGENWHDFVTYAVEKNWGGIENLAFIPGLVGAAPIQNIAAYGENFSDVFISLDAFNVESGEVEVFDKEKCGFGYRESIFKRELKGKYIILRVRMKLSKIPKLETSYYQIGIVRDGVKQELEKISKGPYSIKDVYQAVINIRTRKLPDPKKIPTAGSFFLNSIVSKEKYEELKKKVPELQCYPPDQVAYKKLNDPALAKEDFVKVATGRLLENLGWLGKWDGNVGVHDKHALVIVTNGEASGAEILKFSELIKKSYLENYGIPLEAEVNLI